jgi:hypothetical protein
MYPHVQPGDTAGWFSDPELPSRLRWWSGVAWTEHVQEVPPPPVAGALAVTGAIVAPAVFVPATPSAPIAFTPPAVTVAVAPAPFAVAPVGVAPVAIAPVAIAPVAVAPAVAPVAPAPLSPAPPPFAPPAGFAPVPPAAIASAPAVPASAPSRSSAPRRPGASFPRFAVPSRQSPRKDDAEQNPFIITVAPERRERRSSSAPAVVGRVVDAARRRPGTRVGATVVPDETPARGPVADSGIGSPMTGAVWVMALFPIVAWLAILLFLSMEAFERFWYLGWLAVAALAVIGVVLASMDGAKLKERGFRGHTPAILGLVPPLYLLVRIATITRSSVAPLLVWLVVVGVAANWMFQFVPWVLPLPGRLFG